jgi:alpha-amylase
MTRIASIVTLCATLLCDQRLFAQAAEKRPSRLWEDEIVYVVIVQKFFNGNPANDAMRQRFGRQRERYEGGFWGGDIEGIIQKLDYLADLGVTTLLLYPVMANDTRPMGKYLPTGYRPRDYFAVDENFGDVGTLKRLVDVAHERQMRVILDLPLAMGGFEHPYRRDGDKREWFGPMTRYGVTQWNAENPEVASYLVRVSQFWKEQTGCDGFRLDSAQLYSQRFWQDYVRQLDPSPQDDFFLLAELPLHPREIGGFLNATGFDGAYDFSAMTAQEVFGKGDHAGKLSFVLRAGGEFYPTPERMCAQIDNYEDPDFLTVAREPRAERMKLAMAFLLTLNRIPLVYSGDEAALSYRDVGALFDLPAENAKFVEFTKMLIALRKREVALRRGGFIEVHVRESVYAFLRTHGDARLLVVLNNSAQPQTVSFPLESDAWQSVELVDLITNKRIKAKENAAPLELEPWEFYICRVAR